VTLENGLYRYFEKSTEGRRASTTLTPSACVVRVTVSQSLI